MRHHGRRMHHGGHRKPIVFGTTKVGERGQIVIPKEAREEYDISAGDTLFVLGDEEKRGLAIVKADFLEGFALQILRGIGYFDTESEDVDGNNEQGEEKREE